MKHILIITAALGTAVSFAQSENLRLDAPLLDKTDSGLGQPVAPGRLKPLGYEGTPLAPKKDEETPKKSKGQTEITASEATFDQKTRQAVFIGEVVVKDPEFSVNCDRLTAVMKKPKSEAGSNGTKPVSAKPAANPPPASPSPAADKPKDKDEPKGGGLDHAIADANSGNVVVITQEKVESDGSLSRNIGKGRRVTYDATSGDIVLTGMPNVQQGINLCIATDESTVMTLNRSGKMKVQGPHKTVIKDTSSADAK